jgi:Sulfotransferase family
MVTRRTLPGRRVFRRARRRIRSIVSARSAPTTTSNAPGTMSDGTPAMHVLFLGGTARSGTSITARLLGVHSAYTRIPIETKFLSSPGGLCDLVEGKTTLAAFRKETLGKWFDGVPQHGLQKMVTRDAIEAALHILEGEFRTDRWAAARRFTHALFDPVARAAGTPGWIEKFPANVRNADVLYRIFPNMRLIHLVRDGRDVATSVLHFGWGPDDPDEALDWWARRLERGFAACDRVPPDRISVVQMEDLVARNRDREYRRLLEFLDLADDAAMHRYFDENVTGDRSHMGRWRQDIPAERLAAFEAHHERLAADLRRRGRPYVPVELEAEVAAVG